MSDVVAQHIESALEDPSIKSTIVLLLNHGSEIKHEDSICSLISAQLRERDIDSRRKWTQSKKDGWEKTRCVDIEIAGHQVEAKYHLEGDIVLIDEKISSGEMVNFNPDTDMKSPTETKEVCYEILRPTPVYFLWMVCVRSAEGPKEDGRLYKYPARIRRFYKKYGKRGVHTYLDATVVAESEIDGTIWTHFRSFAKSRGRKIQRVKAMPAIVGNHSSLIVRLYRISSAR